MRPGKGWSCLGPAARAAIRMRAPEIALFQKGVTTTAVEAKAEVIKKMKAEMTSQMPTITLRREGVIRGRRPGAAMLTSMPEMILFHFHASSRAKPKTNGEMTTQMPRSVCTRLSQPRVGYLCLVTSISELPPRNFSFTRRPGSDHGGTTHVSGPTSWQARWTSLLRWRNRRE